MNKDERGWTVDETSGIAIPQTREEWRRFIEHHGLTIENPIVAEYHPAPVSAGDGQA